MRVRRSPTLICNWEPQGLQVMRPPGKERVQLSARIVRLLADLGDWRQAEDVDPGLYGFTHQEFSPVLQELKRLGVIEMGQPAPSRDYEDIWAAWGGVTECYHALSRDANYVIGGEGSAELDEELVSACPAPPQFKSYPESKAIPLPRTGPVLSRGLGDTLLSRRTYREFEEKAIRLEELSVILHYTFAPIRFTDSGRFGNLPLKTSPSAGSRHEAECYLIPLRVDGAPPGLYHYDGLRHALEVVDQDFSAGQLGDLVYGQRACLSSAFVCFTTAVARRLTWKYRHPRAYRLPMIDAGHYAQSFALTVTALGLGAFQTIAFRDDAVERALGIADGQEFAVYALAAGHPVLSESGMPSRYRQPGPFDVE